MLFPDHKEEYCQARANKTKENYLLTVIGHCLIDCEENRVFANDFGGGISKVFYPIGKEIK